MCIRERPYPRFFLTSGPHMALAYMTNGCKEYAKMILENAIRFQEPNGMYLDCLLYTSHPENRI